MEVTSTDTHDTWEEGVPSVPWVVVVDYFQQKEDRIVVAPEAVEVVVMVEEVRFGGMEDQPYSGAAEDACVDPVG